MIESNSSAGNNIVKKTRSTKKLAYIRLALFIGSAVFGAVGLVCIVLSALTFAGLAPIVVGSAMLVVACAVFVSVGMAVGGALYCKATKSEKEKPLTEIPVRTHDVREEVATKIIQNAKEETKDVPANHVQSYAPENSEAQRRVDIAKKARPSMLFKYNLGDLCSPITKRDTIKITVGGAHVMVNLSELPKNSITLDNAVVSLSTNEKGSIVLFVEHYLRTDSSGNFIADDKGVSAHKLADDGVVSVAVVSKFSDCVMSRAYYMRNGMQFSSAKDAKGCVNGYKLTEPCPYASCGNLNIVTSLAPKTFSKYNSLLQSYINCVREFQNLCKKISGLHSNTEAPMSDHDAKKIKSSAKDLSKEIAGVLKKLEKHQDKKNKEFPGRVAHMAKAEKISTEECLERSGIRAAAYKLAVYEDITTALREINKVTQSIYKNPKHHHYGIATDYNKNLATNAEGDSMQKNMGDKNSPESVKVEDAPRTNLSKSKADLRSGSPTVSMAAL